VQSTDQWLTKFNMAANVYRNALYGDTTIKGTERERFANQFQSWIHEFKEGRASSLSVLESELESEDVYRYNAAARLLIELADLKPLQRLSEKIIQSGKPRLSDHNLTLLWIAAPPDVNLFEQLAGRWEQISFVQAFLNQPSIEAATLLERILDTDEMGLSKFAIEAAISWVEKDRLKQFMDKPSAKQIIGDYVFEDARFPAAFYLGLGGDSKAISFLEDNASGDDLTQASFACHYLGWLALPNALRPVKRLLGSKDTYAVALTLGTAVSLGSPALIPILLDLISWKVNTRIDPKPISDLAIQALRQIIGAPLDNLSEKYVPESFPAEYTDTYRKEVMKVCQEILPDFQLTLRYHSGYLVTLAHLAEDLLNPHSSPICVAAHNLKAITGEDYGFNLNADLITNLPAIKAWKKRAENPQPLTTPGGWAFKGFPLSDLSV